MSEELTLFEWLAEDGYTKEAEIIKKYYRNAVHIYYRVSPDGVPVGASKSGGCPDLPPEMELPDMPLVVQINLYELAESGADVENLLPKTGILYIFWNYEIEDKCKYDVIYWNGDMSTLRHCGNSGKEEYAIEFEVHGGRIYEEYDEKGVYCEGLRDLVANYGYDPDALVESDDKLLGYPIDRNKIFEAEDVLLFQFDCHEGCIWKVYWIIKKSDLKNLDFSRVLIDFDMD
ncbi:MAG: DUF1963 domain-containing protein [Ruminococcus sp.]|nr:DUF1963 domain-containing protein [Ruminococcus sp.]